MLKVNELFSGIGAFRKALNRLNIPHEIVGISEIDKYAIMSYEAIFGETRNYGDISKVSKLDYADLWTYGFPCQDISLAGQQAGIIRGQTRSGLLYEVQRLLGMAALYDELPKYLILENVKNLVGKKFLSDFESWIAWLDALGYNTYWKVINAKDCGIPQNRERVFAVSIRKDIDRGYTFPDPIPLAQSMFDFLEDEVDEKFYISDAILEQYRSSTDSQILIGNGFAFTPVERERERENGCSQNHHHTGGFPDDRQFHKRVGIVNPAAGGTCRTIKAQYHKSSAANFVRSGSFGATGVIDYE